MSTAQIAVAYAKRGWHVLPVFAGDKRPYFPLAPAGYKSATNDVATVEKWFSDNPHLNIGIACAPSGLVVMDIDYRNGGTSQGLNLATFTVATGDGLHLYYSVGKDAHFKGMLRGGVDIKHNGYVVAGGSTHPNGKFYEVICDMEPVACEVFA
tara:strand:+ start:69 stop:527 length:459 start_codon:yes stop_codon:yes gene_type:complete